MRARIAGGNRIDVTAHHVRRVKLYLDDTLVDLDRPVAISVNGEDVFTGKIPRSLHTALEQVRATPHRQAPAAVIEVAVPASARSVADGSGGPCGCE